MAEVSATATDVSVTRMTTEKTCGSVNTASVRNFAASTAQIANSVAVCSILYAAYLIDFNYRFYGW